MTMSETTTSTFAARLFGKRTGPLGFGTGLLHQVGDASTCVRLLREAHEQGVAYFDTARLYAEGESERLLGEAFRGLRSEVILATKVGILPVKRDLATRAKGKAASALRKFAPLKAVVPDLVQHPEFGVFDRKRMQESLETSLRLLRTDYVDLLLLHECTLDNVRSDDVQTFLSAVVRDGKARMVGVAPTAPEMLSIASSGVAYGDVAQFDSRIRHFFPPSGAAIPALVVTHSCLGEPYKGVVNRLKTDDALRARWSGELGIDARDNSQVAQAFLAQALAQNPEGMVLFSTTRPERLRQNLVAESWLSTPDRCDVAARLIAEASATVEA